MRERPISITVIGWLLIISGGTSLIWATLNLHNPRTTVSYAGVLVSLVCGVGILKAQNWARFLYVILGVISLVFYVVWGIMGLVVAYVSPGTLPGKIMMLLLPLLFFLVIAFSLFNPKTNEYFTGTEIQGDS